MGRKNEIVVTPRQYARTTQRHAPRCTMRRSPPLPVRATYPLREMMRCWSQNSSTVMARSGIEYAAATSSLGGNSKNCHSVVVITWKRAGSAMRAGTPKSAMASRNSTMRAARMAGRVRGSVIFSVRADDPRAERARGVLHLRRDQVEGRRA